jgi:hexosaminidase
MKRALLAICLLSACAHRTAPAPAEGTTAAAPPARLAVRFRPVEHGAAGTTLLRAELSLENHDQVALRAAGGWKLCFSLASGIRAAGAPGVAPALAAQGLSLQSAGDYRTVAPLPGFAELAPGATRVITLAIEGAVAAKSDAPAGFHLVVAGQATALRADVDLDPTDPRQTTRSAVDVLPVQTAALRFAENQSTARLELGPAGGLLPAPLSVTPRSGSHTLASAAVSHGPALASEAAYLTAALRDVGVSATGAPAITLSVDGTLDVTGDGAPDPEGYTLAVDATGVKIVGTDAAGVFYGIQTLRQLLPPRPPLVVPALLIKDAPLFGYRGMALDVGRHFQTKETVEKLLDVLAHHKINRLHFHLSDDEGWRLEIPGLPELTSTGSRRGFDPGEERQLHPAFGSSGDLAATDDGIRGKPASEAEANGGVPPAFQGFEAATLNFVGPGSGHYSTRDFEEILAFATERHIEVVPEIDMPIHARAAVRAMELRYQRLRQSDPAAAARYRLLDPTDSSHHSSIQGYTDNIVNPCLESTYAFLTLVVQQIKARYAAVPGARLAMFHAGGDELPPLSSNVWWQGSPACKATADTRALDDPHLRDRFFTRWAAIITAIGARMTGWDDIVHGGLDLPGFVAMPWNNVWGGGEEDRAYRIANGGGAVILAHATNLYMDLAYNKDPDEPGYTWASTVDERKTFEYLPFDIFASAIVDGAGRPLPPSRWTGKTRLTDAGRAHILGLEGLLWGENIKSPRLLEYMAFPKILGVAERAWNRRTPTAATLPAQWQRFSNVLGQAALPRLGGYRFVDLRHELPAATGINYRIPLPGARLDDGQLLANVRYPGFTVDYSTDRGATWIPWRTPVPVKGPVLVRTRAPAPDMRTSRIAPVFQGTRG